MRMQINILFVLFLIVAVEFFNSTADPVETKWQKFKQEYNKNYKTSREHNKRKAIFMDNLEKITKHNRKYEHKRSTYLQGVTRFADLTTEEFRRCDQGVNHKFETPSTFDGIISNNRPIPPTIDWVKAGAVTEVKYQGTCLASWAFSAVAAIEGAHYIIHNELVELSPQNLIDCCDASHMGCKSGSSFLAFSYVSKNGGIAKEDSYPFETVAGDCRYEDEKKGASISSYNYILDGNEETMKTIVASYGPMAAEVDNICFQFYLEGIMDCEQCSNAPANSSRHMVAVVGYGTEEGHDYWLIKNSWGIFWGEKGYAKLSRNKNNQCAIASRAVFAEAH